MPLSKIIKTFVSSLALGIGMFTLPSTAYAQFSVVDVAALKQRALEELKTKAHFGSQIAHYAEQIKKYEEQISQLEKEFDSITGIKFSNIRESGIQGEDQRIRLWHALEGKGETFGLGLPDKQTKPMLKYHQTYRFLQPEELHPENEELQRQVRELHKTLYALDSVTGETTLGKKQRLEVYTELAEKSAAAVDIKGSLEVNNALLLENGRNLALLIELQTVQLAAESVNLREKAHSQQSVASVFGATGDGS